MNRKPIIIVGMARSGTTLASHLLGSLPDVHLEIEPHVMWKTGNFRYLSDTEFDICPDAVRWIRESMLDAAGEKILVEKSPVNSIRPALVHAAFPDARIVYVERDLVRCINSNLKRSLAMDSFKPSLIIHKYLHYTGSKDLEGAIGKRRLHRQLRSSDYLAFLLYSMRMIWLRNVKKILPFGPKLKDFQDIVARDGFLAYHVQVAKEAIRCKSEYQSCYGTSLQTFQLERLQTSEEEIRRFYDFCGFDVKKDFIRTMMSTFNEERVSNAVAGGKADMEIRSKLAAEGIG